MTTKKRSTKEPAQDTAAADIRAFAFHFGEALRLARTSDAISKNAYNLLADARNEMMNDEAPTGFWDSPEFVTCLFDAVARQAEGGAR